MNEFLIIAVAIFIVAVIFFYQKGNKSFKREKKQRYMEAIRSGNRTRALEAGRDYYAYMNGGKLTPYDEQAIQNDLSTMKI